ncbi:hypothetical protein ACFW04_014578 [Cataglyphis niger]
MHLVCLGVTKKLLCAWVHGKYSRLSKLSGRSIFVLYFRLNVLKKYCPSEFARPRSLDIVSKFKATEFRQFLLYTVPIVMFDILNNRFYKHFLFLHVVIRILISNSLSKRHLNFALALQKFVLRSPNLYGPTFNSYNVHDSFSAFPCESNMSIFRKYCRKPGLPLQQIFNMIFRMTEINIHGTIIIIIDTRDNCCILHDGSICIIFNIIMNNNSYRLAVKRFSQVEDFYDIDMLSSNI